MNINEIFENIIVPAVKEYNLSAQSDRQVIIQPDTKLVGHGAVIDSIGLVSLIVSIEEIVFSKTGKSITLASEKAVSRSSSPFKTLNSLSEYIYELLQE